MTTPGHTITASIRDHAQRHQVALIPYVTAGFPTRAAFASQLEALSEHAAAIEIGVPFSDPMADGATIQRSSRIALEQGTTLEWILGEVGAFRSRRGSKGHPPLLLMGYLNPMLARGFKWLVDQCSAAGIAALIIPDLPNEESDQIRQALHAKNIGLVQLVSPVTPPERAKALAQSSDGFLYAVTVTGVTGSATSTAPSPAELNAYLDRLRAISPVPVCAGFGIRTAAHVTALHGHADGAIAGSAIIEAIEQGRNPGSFLASLRNYR